MSDDLIKRSDAIKIMACEMYAEAQSQGFDVDSVEDFIPEAKAWMSDAPSIEIIRCRECKHWKSTVQMPNGTEVKCLYGRKADDFCSYGQRKESE